ncbi:MAG TPA: 50S ribosomal protein L13 [bacterium]|nr:50S ribosomal protein L13 [bacterium]HEX68470.1 50S ribosomal protein L13 [bacterium]
MKTYFPTKEEVEKMGRKWYLIDAKGKILGRLASKIALILQGKHKPYYTPHLDVGDYVVVINAKDVKLTGKKEKEKKYYWHSGYVGGLKVRTAEELRAKKPEELIIHAVRGMLPKNSLGRKMLKKLKVYAGNEHPHQAQNPEPLEIPGA